MNALLLRKRMWSGGCLSVWNYDMTKVYRDFFRYAERTREEVCYQQVFMQLCIHVNWNVSLYHMFSSCCSHSWINAFWSSSVPLVLSGRLFTQLLPWGRLCLLLEFVSYLLFHCTPKPLLVLLYLLNSLPEKKPCILTGELWRVEVSMKVFVLQNWAPDPFLSLGSGRDSTICSALALCSSVDLKHSNPVCKPLCWPAEVTFFNI